VASTQCLRTGEKQVKERDPVESDETFTKHGTITEDRRKGRGVLGGLIGRSANQEKKK